jgi:hypothetical protein
MGGGSENSESSVRPAMGFSLIKYTKGTRAEQSHDRIRTVGEGDDER